MKKIHILSIVLFFSIIVIPLFTMNFKTNQVSVLDNKALPEWKNIGSNVDLTSDIEDFISSRIGLRSQMLNTYMNLNDQLFHVLLHPTYTYGRDGYIFFHMSDEETDPEYLDGFADFIRKCQNYCEDKGATFLYCLNPNKSMVYQEYLPKGVNPYFPRQQYLLQALENKNINYIDNTPVLIEAKKDMQVFDKKYDAGHWNDNGAYLGMKNIVNQLQKDYSNIPDLSQDDFDITEESRVYMPLSAFVINDVTSVYTKKTPQAVDVTQDNDPIQLDKTYHDFTHFVNPTRSDLPKILIFRGSYFLGREKFMNELFSESIFVHSYRNILNLDYYFELFDPDIVVFESVEYATKSHYFPLKKMNKKKF